jgi:hypothetical protein
LLIAMTVLSMGRGAEGKAFPGKLIYTDTPEIGAKWHGGVRMVDVLAWDFNWNINGWMSADLLVVGLNDIKGENGERITDRFSLLTLKSLPYRRQTGWGEYAFAGGLKMFGSEFKFQVQGDTNAIQSKNQSGGFFLTQSLNNGRHSVNLLTTLSQRKVRLSTGEDERGTFYFAPGYAYSISKNWRVAAEHYWTNTEWLPIKALQFAFDKDKSEFHNPNQDIYSFLFWGFQYRRKHLRIDLNLAHHISFTKPIFPVMGIGWHF